jgi:hypothetical protein
VVNRCEQSLTSVAGLALGIVVGLSEVHRLLAVGGNEERQSRDACVVTPERSSWTGRGSDA